MKKSKILEINSLDEMFDLIGEDKLSDKILKKSVIVYCRVSTVKQTIDGESIENQMKFGVEYFENNKDKIKYENILVFKEVFSGDSDEYSNSSNKKREMLSYIISKMDNGCIKHIWFLDFDRLGRNSSSFNYFINDIVNNNVNIYEMNRKLDVNNYGDTHILKMIMLMNEWENYKRWDRFNWGKIEHCKKNKWYGGTYPFGYKKGNENGHIIVDKENEKYVKKIFELCKNGKSTKEIVLFLNKENVKSPKTKSGVWNDQTIRNILKSEKYIGKHLVEITLLKGKSKEYCRDREQLMSIPQSIPKIIDEKLFNEVQTITDNWSTNKNKSKTKYNYLINDIVYCGHCGNKMKINNRKKSDWFVYHCDYSTNKWRDFDNRVKKCGKGIFNNFIPN